MKKIILAAHGFQKNYDLERSIISLLPNNINELSSVIITTASLEWKELNKHAIFAKQKMENMGFNRVDFLDVEFDDPNKLKNYDLIYINGGNPFYLLYHLKKSGADKIISILSNQGIVIIGISAGAVVLGPNINIVDYLDESLNILSLKDFTGLNLVENIVYPHYSEEMEEKIKSFELKFNIKVDRLLDNQSIVINE